MCVASARPLQLLPPRLSLRPLSPPPGVSTPPSPHLPLQLKPSQGAPKKRRFFQLSTDYTQLRWAWDKSIYMFHVQDIVKHEEQLQVELRMLDRTLILGFLVRGSGG